MAEAGGDQVEYRTVDDPAQRFAIEQRRMNLEAGWLGGIFGSKANAPTNIAGIGLILLILPLFFMLFFSSNISLIIWREYFLSSGLSSATCSARVREDNSSLRKREYALCRMDLARVR